MTEPEVGPHIDYLKKIKNIRSYQAQNREMVHLWKPAAGYCTAMALCLVFVVLLLSLVW